MITAARSFLILWQCQLYGLAALLEVLRNNLTYATTMFSKLPQRFSAPFGLLGDEAKLAFPSQPGGITKLATTRVGSVHLIL